MSKLKSNTIPSTVKSIAAATGLTHVQVKLVLTQLITEAIEGLKRDSAYSIHGIAQLKMKTVPAKAERIGRNPATGESLTIAAKPETTRIMAKPVTALKRAIDPKAVVKRTQRSDQT